MRAWPLAVETDHGSSWAQKLRALYGRCLDTQLVAPPTPFKESRVAIVINNPQKFKLLGQGALWIKAGISRTATAVMAGLFGFGVGSVD